MWLGISHCNFWIRILPEGLEKHTQSKTSFYAYADMEKASLKIKDYGWIKNLILLLSIFTPNTATMGLAMKDTSTILVIEMKKDRPWHLTPSNLVGGIDLVKALHKNGVPLDEKLTKALEEE
jgi:hypothetical protein